MTSPRVELGREASSSGQLILQDTGSLTVDTRLVVSRSGSAEMIINGGTLTTAELLVGRYAGSANLGIENSASQITITKNMTLGAKATFLTTCGSKICLTYDDATASAAGFKILSNDSLNLIGLNNLELRFQGGAEGAAEQTLL